MQNVRERRYTQAVWIFDVEDRYAREQRRRSRSYHPRPIGSLQFWLVGQVIGGTATPFPQSHEMCVVQNPSGYLLFFGDVLLTTGESPMADGPARRARSDSRRRRLALADGRYMVRVDSPFYRSELRDDIFLPMPDPNDPGSGAPYRFDLSPSHAYPFPESRLWRPSDPTAPCPGAGSSEEWPPGANQPGGGSTLLRGGSTLLRGSLFTFDGQPVRDTTVQVDMGARTYSYTTDRDGQWILVFDRTQPTGPVVVQVRQPGSPVVNVSGVCVIRGRETTLYQTALRGWVLRNGAGVPGAAVRISGQPRPTTTRSDGSWFYYFGLTQPDTAVTVTAALPEGGPGQTRPAIQVRSRRTVVVDAFRF